MTLPTHIICMDGLAIRSRKPRVKDIVLKNKPRVKIRLINQARKQLHIFIYLHKYSHVQSGINSLQEYFVLVLGSTKEKAGFTYEGFSI
jgi:hypothetical protein